MMGRAKEVGHVLYGPHLPLFIIRHCPKDHTLQRYQELVQKVLWAQGKDMGGTDSFGQVDA